MEYQPIITVKCSSDLIADPADRITPNHQHIMLLECMEEGTVRWNNNAENLDWIDVGTILGEVTTEDDCDGGVEEDEEWTWQAYLHDDVDESTQPNKGIHIVMYICEISKIYLYLTPHSYGTTTASHYERGFNNNHLFSIRVGQHVSGLAADKTQSVRCNIGTYVIYTKRQNTYQTVRFIHESVIIMVDQSFQKLSFRYQNIVMICTKRVHTWFVTSTLPLPEKKSMIKRGIKEKLYSYIVNMSKFNHDSHYLSFLQNNSSPVSLCYGQLLIEDIGS